jgi:hypothetical protein
MPEVETWASSPSICISQFTIEHTWTSLSWHMEGANTKKVGVTNILSFTFLSYDRAFINNHLTMDTTSSTTTNAYFPAKMFEGGCMG